MSIVRLVLQRVATPINYAAILDVYSLEEILEQNDLTTEDALEFMVEEEFIKLPTVTPLEFE